MKTITLYTGKGGYLLFEKGMAFLATEDKQEAHDYEVTVPIKNIVEYPLEDSIGCYDVIKMDGVIVNHIIET